MRIVVELSHLWRVRRVSRDQELHKEHVAELHGDTYAIKSIIRAHFFVVLDYGHEPQKYHHKP
jgi:hypothetical protein